MRLFWGLLRGLMVVGIATGGVDAHIGDRIVPIFELTDEDLVMIDLHDMSVDDWRTVVGEPSLTAIDFFVDPRFEDSFYDPIDLDYQIWLAWHRMTNRIYLAMERVDDVYVHLYDPGAGNPYSSDMRHSDGFIEFMIDGDHSGGQYYGYTVESPEWEFAHRGAQRYGAIAETPDDRHLELWGDMDDRLHVTDSPYAVGGGGRVGAYPFVSVLEFFITPFDQLIWSSPTVDDSQISLLFPDKIIGLSLTIWNIDAPVRGFSTDWSGAHSLGITTQYPANSADFFFDGRLLEISRREPDDTAVSDVSWGRIKASFR